MGDDDLIPGDSSRVLAEVGGLIDETRVTLGLYGVDLDPDEVSKVLGCPPSRAYRRGDPRRRNVEPWPKGAWLLSTEGKAPVEPEHLLSALLDRLPTDPLVWKELRARFDVRLGLGLFQGAWNRGFSLSSELLRRIATLDIPLDFDIYAEGEDLGV